LANVKKSSPLKLLGQIRPNLAGSIYVRFSIKPVHLVPFDLSLTVIEKETCSWKCDANLTKSLNSNKNCSRQPYLLAKWNEMKKLYRGPYIDASCKVWLHLAKQHCKVYMSVCQVSLDLDLIFMVKWLAAHFHEQVCFSITIRDR
jgi:hypothetical protein